MQAEQRWNSFHVAAHIDCLLFNVLEPNTVLLTTYLDDRNRRLSLARPGCHHASLRADHGMYLRPAKLFPISFCWALHVHFTRQLFHLIKDDRCPVHADSVERQSRGAALSV